MPSRLRIRMRQYSVGQVLKLVGELDGSTAAHALDVLAHIACDGRELVLDLSALTTIEPFGLEVLSRGLKGMVRARSVRIIDGAPRRLPPPGTPMHAE